MRNASRFRFIVASFAGAIAIQASLIACSHVAPAGASASATDASFIDRFVNGVSKIVDSAPSEAKPGQLLVFEEPCSHVDPGTSSADLDDELYAEPCVSGNDGRPAQSGACSRTGRRPQQVWALADYRYRVTSGDDDHEGVLVKDGAVLAFCGFRGTFSKVLFILEQ